jgi:chemotaxis protein MotB
MSAAATAENRGLRKRRNRQQVLVSQERWLVSYADFMTLLFAFFVVLFAVSRHNGDSLGKLSGAIHSGFSGPESASGANVSQRLPGMVAHFTIKGQAQRAASAPSQQPDLDPLAGQLRSVLGDSIQKHEVSLQQTSDGLVISFQELGFFHSGEANLLPGQATEIVEAGAILQQHGLALRVEGHSDDQPIHNAVFASNWELSAARAMTVLLLLVDQTHYDPTRISMAGYGPYRPVADNATQEGRQKNRRVDLVVVQNADAATQEGLPNQAAGR